MSNFRFSNAVLFLIAFQVVFSVFPAFAVSDYYSQNPAAPFHSTTLQENAPVQIAARTFPKNIKWVMKEIPTINTYKVSFSGTPGLKASHEGMDFVHNNPKVPVVPVVAADHGTVAYVRTGAPQSSMFKHNTSLREAGAGWGNHVVLYHGNGVYTRYAHLAPDSIKLRVGARVTAGDVIGEMGNTGRSETRHLHFEVGFKNSYFVANKPSQSFDLVLSPESFFPVKQANKPATQTGIFITDENNVRSGPSSSETIMLAAPKKTPVSILAVQGDWFKVQFTHNNTVFTGWSHKSNVKITNPSLSASAAASAGFDSYQGSSSARNDADLPARPKEGTFVSDTNNVRASPSKSSTVMLVAPKGLAVRVLYAEGDWLKLQFVYDRTVFTGWSHKSNVSYAQ